MDRPVGSKGCVAYAAGLQRRRKQEVARARAGTRRPRAQRPSGARLVVTGTVGQRDAQCWAVQVSPSLSAFPNSFCFSVLQVCFDLV